MAKTKMTITIAGKEYAIVSEDSAEHINRIEFTLNDKIARLSGESISLSTLMQITLAALNVTDDYLKASDALQGKNESIDQLTKQLRTIEIEKSIADASNLKLTDRNRNAESELARLRETLSQLEKENEALRKTQNSKVLNPGFRSGN